MFEMDKCREEFEKTRTFKSIYSTLMYFEESLDLYTTKEKWREEDAWRLTYAWWAYKELQTRIDSKREATKGGFSQWFKTTNYFGAYFTDLDLTLNHRDQFENDIINSAWLAHQSRQTEVDELQKRVKFLEQELGAWKGKSIAAMVNGMCKQCGKEPLQAIVSDKECYALLHCFGCGADKYELIGEQALKGEG
ncbi:hypothetical protein IH414_17840 [Acinetobacter baumannii]|nr:hypothetical protein [Acinetobacter baumannii]MCD7388248.1 hypothetical protein [Acinetobacter baumannii]MCD7390087.1 hypothetical protein [Acinetobacter baumannii]MCD7401331.1 hypothetical protein [Acinetobacter baumannii]